MVRLFYVDNDKEYYVGDLYYENRNNKDLFSFECSNEWLISEKKFIFDPEINLYKGRQYSSKGIFGFINDLSPDRFGRLLLDEKERKEASIENRIPKKLTAYDYLLGVNDLSRMGALRIKNDKDEYLANYKDESIPPYIYLRDIEFASQEFEKSGLFDKKEYQRLLLPGSSLGGARPKANIYFNDELWIAKFPSINDNYDIEAWEKVAFDLAALCKIKVPKSKLEKYSLVGSTLLTKRFDREKNNRIHYVSFMNLLDASDGDSGSYSYLDLVAIIKSTCVDIKEELKELYKRLVFSYLINNTDNHLRNHGLIYKEEKYTLSPVFDINPTFFISSFALPLTYSETTKENIILEAKYYDLSKDEALKIYQDIGDIIANNIDRLCLQNNLKNKEKEIFMQIFISRK